MPCTSSSRIISTVRPETKDTGSSVLPKFLPSPRDITETVPFQVETRMDGSVNSSTIGDDSTLGSMTLPDFQLAVIGSPNDFMSPISRQKRLQNRTQSSRSIRSGQSSFRTVDSESVFERLYRNDAPTSRSARRRQREKENTPAQYSTHSRSLHLDSKYKTSRKSLNPRVDRREAQRPTTACGTQRKSNIPKVDDVFERLYRGQRLNRSTSNRQGSVRRASLIPRKELFHRRGTLNKAYTERAEEFWESIPVDRRHELSGRIQRSWRLYFSRKAAASKIQKKWRAIHRHRSFRSWSVERKYHMLMASQDSWQRQKIKRHAAASRIQAVFRCFATLRKYQVTLFFIVVIQQWWKRRLESIAKERSAKMIQSLWLSHKLRSKSAMTMQSWWLQRRQNRLEAELHRKACTIQRLYRSFRDERRRSVSATLIQMSWRNYRMAQAYAAVKFQSLFRVRTAALSFQLLKKSVKVVQKWWRYNRARRLEDVRTTNEYLMACRIQSKFRQASQRSHYLRLKSCSVKLQAAFRKLLARHRLGSLLDERKRKNAATIIQSYWRRRIFHRHFLILDKQATKIQSQWRMWTIQQDYLFLGYQCELLQGWWLGVQQKRRFLMSKAAALKIQSVWRKTLAVQHWEKILLMESVATKIQSHFRMWYKRQNFLLVATACGVIQTWWFGAQARKRYLLSKSAAVQVQSIWRMTLAVQDFRQKLASHRERLVLDCAAVKVQSQWRMWSNRQGYLLLSSSCFAVQAWWLGTQARKVFLQSKAAVVRIQSFWRMSLAIQNFNKRLLLKSAATKIQSQWQMWSSRKSFLLQVSGCALIQARWLGLQARKRYLLHKFAAVKVQSIWRKTLALQDFRKRQLLNSAGVKIQSYWRAWSTRQEFLQLVSQTMLVQAWWLGLKERKRYLVSKSAAVRIQCSWRRAMVIQDFRQKLASHRERLAKEAAELALKEAARFRARLENSVNSWVEQILSTKEVASDVPCLNHYVFLARDAREQAGLSSKSSILDPKII